MATDLKKALENRPYVEHVRQLFRRYAVWQLAGRMVGVSAAITDEQRERMTALTMQVPKAWFEQPEIDLDMLRKLFSNEPHYPEDMEQFLVAVHTSFRQLLENNHFAPYSIQAGLAKEGDENVGASIAVKVPVETYFKVLSSHPYDMVTEESVTYLERLKPYFRKSEYRHLSYLVENNMEFAPGAMDACMELLEELRVQGLAYELGTWHQKGAVQVSLVDTKMLVQVLAGQVKEPTTEAREQALKDMYRIGQILDDGHMYRFYREGEHRHSQRVVGLPTHADRKEMLLFALGKHTEAYTMTFNKSSRDATVTNFHMQSPTGLRFMVAAGTRVHLPFKDALTAELFVRNALDTARENYMKNLDLDMIKECIREEKAFEVSEAENLQTMQGFLYHMGMKARALDEAEKLHLVNMHDPNDTLYDVGIYHINIALDVTENIETSAGWEAFLDSYVQAVIHTGLRSFDDGFDPVWAASLLDTHDMFLSRGELLVEALKLCNYDPNKLLTTDNNESFYAKKLRDALITFDPDSSRDYSEMEHPFGKLVLQEAKAALKNSGIQVKEEDVRLDEQGVLHWQGVRVLTPTSTRKSKQLQTVKGQLGQIFLPDDRGVIVTQFGGSDNYETIPAYRAYLLPRDNSAQDTFRERHRLVGYQEQMLGVIRKQLRHDALSNGGYGHVATVGSSISLNKLYGRLYDRRYEIGELDIAARYEDLPESFAEAIQKTLAGRVRYDAMYEESTTNAASMAELYGFDEKEGVYTPYMQTNQRNLRVLDPSMDGIFDPQATGGAYNQGLVRYLTEDATVGEGGVLIQGLKAYCALLNEPEFANCIRYNDWVRVAMAVQQALTAKRVDHHVGTAMVGFGGWNMEDGFVVSKEFAERNMIMDTSGKYRHLRRGDKVSDFNGNKGVIGLIVDRRKTAKEQTVVPHLPFPEEAVQFFVDNPDVDVVLSPYSPISRANGGAIRDLALETADLNVNGRVVKGAVGFTNFIITDKTVDEKTSLYDDPDGSIGRRVSSSLAWALDSAGCTAIKDFVFGSNIGAVENLREYLIAVGYDLAADGTVLPAYTPHAGENRRVFSITPPDPTKNPILWDKERDNERYQEAYNFAEPACYDKIQYKSHKQGKKNLSLAPVESYEGPRGAFMAAIANQGGFLEVPWPLSYYTDPSSTPKSLQAVQKEDGRVVYRLPIIAPELRNAQEMQDGDSMAHNFTHRYEQLYTLVYDHYLLTDMITRRKQDIEHLDTYLDEHLEAAWVPHGGITRLEELERASSVNWSARERAQLVASATLTTIWASIDPEVKEAYDAAKTFRQNISEWENTLSYIPDRAKWAFGAISKTVADQYINGKRDKGKNSYLRNAIMGRKMRNTATLVYIPDPRLDLDTVSMSQKTMKSLGLLEAKERENLLWRDPITKDGGIRYLKVVEDPTVDGVGMNPVIAKSYSGDFDGDQAGLLHLTDEKARAEAREKLHPSAHMLERGVKVNGRHPLYFGLDQDIQMSIYENRGKPFGRAGDKVLDMGEYLQQIEYCLNAGVLSGKDGFVQLNQFVKRAFQQSYGASPLRFGNWEDLHADFEHIIQSGAKGNAAKRDNLYYWMGISVGADGKVTDTGTSPPDLRKRQMESQAATAMKTDDTGIAGTFTQRLVQVLRNEEIKLAMELTEPITQGVLSIKSNAAHAEKIDKLLRVDLPNVLYHGVSAATLPGDIKKGRVEQLSKQQFAQELYFILTHEKEGLGVKTNPEYITKLANILSDGNGRIRPLQDLPGTPMDRIAYSSGERTEDGNLITPLMRIGELAASGENLFGTPILADGRTNYIHHFAPYAVRNADATTRIMKASTQATEQIIKVDAKPRRVKESFETAAQYAQERGRVASAVALPQAEKTEVTIELAG